MPRGKKNTTPTAPSAPVTASAEVSPVATTKLETLLLKLRNTCRAYGLQSWNKQSLCDQIYQDLLFIYHLPRLLSNGQMTLDCDEISGGKLTTISYAALLTLKNDPQTMSNIFRRLWRALQTSIVGALFTAREFAMFSIEKDDKKAAKYYKLLVALFEDMNSVVLADYDSNAGYTYFKKDLNKGTAKTFGQFYTPSTVLKSVVKQVNPKVGQMIIDTNCGSCSFVQETATHIMREEKVDKHTAFANLYGIEVERDIYTEGVMNIFTNFGIIPNMETHIREEDAFLVLLATTVKYDGCVANPPFGATVVSFKEFYYTTVLEQKGKKMVKKLIVNPAVKNPIPFPDVGESAILFFQLIPSVLKDGAKMGVVMSATILNDSYTGMMEWFLNLCSLDMIIINPAGTFKEQGTGIETFSFIATKGKPTTTISIVMLGDEDKVIRTLTMDQIREDGWKLDIKGTANVEAVTTNPSEYPIVKLGDIAECKNGKNIPEGDRAENGTYPYYASNGIKGYVEQYNFEGPSVLIGDQGSCWTKSVKYVDTGVKFYAGNHTIVMKTRIDTLNIRYLYYYTTLSNNSQYGKVAAVIPEMDKNKFFNMDIPLPPHSIQDQIVATLDRIFAPGTTDLADMLKLTDRAMDLVLKDPTGGLLEQVVEAIRFARNKLQDKIYLKSQMAAVLNASSMSINNTSRSLKDICVVAFGERITQKDHKGTLYPVYGGGDTNFHTDRYNREGPTCKIARFAVSEKSMVLMIQDKYWLMDSGFTLTSKDTTTVDNEYLWWILWANQKKLSECSTGSCQKNINMDAFYNLEFGFPSIENQRSVVNMIKALNDSVSAQETLSKQSEDNARFILESYLNTA